MRSYTQEKNCVRNTKNSARKVNFEVGLCSEVSKDFQPVFERMTEENLDRLCGDVKADISHNDDDLVWFEKIKERFGV